MKAGPVYRDIVLAGGGYAHLLFIRMWCMQPLPGVRVTLISPLSALPYSGMLPAFLAGEYTAEEIHIDVVRLCQRAGVRLVLDTVEAINPQRKRVQLRAHPALDYDVLSLNTGPAADHSVPGVAEHAIPVKPVSRFLAHWQALQVTLRAADKPLQLVMTGGGAGSVETLLGMAQAIHKDADILHKPAFTLLTANERLLPTYPARVAVTARQRCEALGIRVLCNKRISLVEAGHIHTHDSSSTVLPYDQLLWCTEAAAPAWLHASGLDCDARGFVRVNAHLQSVSHPDIFAAGDITAFEPRALPKAGVYAVRQAPVLFHNLTHALLGKPLKTYRPQARFLSLLALGSQFSAGSYGALAGTGHWLWRWKSRIDRQFMHRFHKLYNHAAAIPQQMHAGALIDAALAEITIDPALRCGGCGGKLGATALAAVLQEVLGKYQPEDASVTAWPCATLVQSTDLLRAPFDDPWLFGRIATLHALNDLYAMNARPHSVQLALTLPFAAPYIQQRELRQLLEGVNSVCREQDIILLGGHSAEGEELSLCLTVNGTPGTHTFHKQALQAGQLLVLGKPLGTGIILAAHMQHRCSGAALEQALQVMNTAQADKAAWLAQQGVQCCTDISGFGLLGHLTEMLGTSDLHMALAPEHIPVLAGATELAAAGVRSSLFPDNEAYVLQAGHFDALRQHALWPLLLDPQTSGGLLAAIPADKKEAAVASGFHVIGQVLAR